MSEYVVAGTVRLMSDRGSQGAGVGDDDDAARIDPGLARRAVRWAVENPFNPGFGTAPPRLAGREVVVAEILERVQRGPGRHDFHTVIVGPRGVG